MSMTKKEKRKKRRINIKHSYLRLASSSNEADYRTILRHGCSSNALGGNDELSLYLWWKSMHC